MPERWRWDTDERFVGVADAGVAGADVERLLEMTLVHGWVTEDVMAHLGPWCTKAATELGVEVIRMEVVASVLEIDLRSTAGDDARPPRVDAYGLIGAFAEGATYVRETRVGGDVVLDVVTASCPATAPSRRTVIWPASVSSVPETVDATERYLFDLNGYLALPGALPPATVAAIDALMDERIVRDVPADATTHRFADVLDWGPEVRALIDHEPILAYLDEFLGTGYRLDHDYADLIRSGKGPIGTRLHGGAVPFDPGQWYTFAEGRPRSGLMVVAYNLRDVSPGDGGFGCIPGSHKANLPFPDAWRELEQDLDGLVRPVTGPAGTAIIFTEAMTHGTLPWSGTGDRRTLFFKYDPGPLAYGAHFYDRARWPDLTPRQRAILESPNARYGGRPTV